MIDSASQTPDQGRLLDLLAEYAAKRRLTCDAYYQRRFQTQMLLIGQFLAIGVGATLWALFQTAKFLPLLYTWGILAVAVLLPLVMLTYLTIRARSELL